MLVWMLGRPWVLVLVTAMVAVVTAAGLTAARAAPDPVVAVEPIRLPDSTTSSSRPTSTSTILPTVIDQSAVEPPVPAPPPDTTSPVAPLPRPELAPTPTFRPPPLDDDARDALEDAIDDAESDRVDAGEDRAERERDRGDD